MLKSLKTHRKMTDFGLFMTSLFWKIRYLTSAQVRSKWAPRASSDGSKTVPLRQPSVFFELHRVTLLDFLSFSPTRDATFSLYRILKPFMTFFLWSCCTFASYGMKLRWCKLVSPWNDCSDRPRDRPRTSPKRPRSS